MKNMGKLLIFSAPSGSGKTTIVKEVLKQIPNLEFSISACSRTPRKAEMHGKDYYFLSVDEFRNKIASKEFVEYEEVYNNQFYGTLKSELQRIWDNGNHVVFDVDVKGGLNIKKQFPKESLSIFIKPPSIEELKKRLLNRGTETEEQIAKRIQKAEYELGFADQFDIIILNEELDVAVKETIMLAKGFLEINH
jgi:guanylate kinase